MSTDTTSTGGVAVGDLGNLEDLPDGMDAEEVNPVQEVSDAEERASQEALSSRLTGEIGGLLHEQIDEPVPFEVPDEMTRIKNNRLFIRMYAPKCFECGHLRPGIGDTYITLDQPCHYSKGNKACPAQHFQFTAISKYAKITAFLEGKMAKAVDGQARLAVLAEFQKRMIGAKDKQINAGLKKLMSHMKDA